MKSCEQAEAGNREATAMYTDVPEDRRAGSNAAMRCLSLSVIHKKSGCAA